jgi:peptide/nickel transport system permease protein
MRVYALKRLLISIPLVFVMTFVVFVIVNWRGATRFDTFENDPAVDPQVIELEKRRLGIYDPVPVRYFHWLRGILFDLRVTQERRFIASFEDNDPERSDDRYRYGGSEIREELGADAEYLVGPEQAQALQGLESAGAVASVLDRRKNERLELAAAAPAPKGLTLVFQTGSGPVKYPFTEADDGSARLQIFLDELARKAATDQIREVRLTAEATGPARVKSSTVRRRVWQETYPGRQKKRTIQCEYLGREGQFIELGVMKSPYTTKLAEGSDWTVDWEALRAKTADSHRAELDKWASEGRKGTEPKPVTVEGIRFDQIEFEAAALSGADLEVELQLLCGPADALRPVAIGKVRLTDETETYSIPLDPAPAGADLKSVRGLRLACAQRGRAEFDDFRLRIRQSPVSLGAPNFGTSWDKKEGVLDLIGGKVKNTIVLNVWGLFAVWLIALPAGIYGAVRQYTMGDRVVSFATYVGMAMPSFFLATLIVFLVSLTYEIPKDSAWSWLHGILPIAGRTSPNHEEMSRLAKWKDLATHMILPVLVGVLGGIGGLQRIVRSMMLEERRKLYITTAMAKGLPPFKVLYKHALRNAIIPFIASLGSLLPGLIGGSAFVEIVFDYPGIGRQMLESVQSYDIPVVMANTLIVGLLLVIGNLLADILLGVVDPRISLEGA